MAAKICVQVVRPEGKKAVISMKNPPRPRDLVLSYLSSYGMGALTDADGDAVIDDLQAGDYTYTVIHPVSHGIGGTVPQVAHGISGSGIDWIEMLRLSDQEKKFLDGFLAKKYSLPEQDTGIAKVPVYGGVPSMLLFDLGRKEFTHATALKEVIERARSKLQNVVVVAGTSGYGKTRSLYDLFSEEDGFYFVMSTELNGGSKDLSEMVKSLEQFLLWEDKTRGNDNVVSIFAMLLLACRMVIYNYCKAAGADSRQWLLLQVASRGMFPGGYDVFLSLFDRATSLLPLTREGVLEHRYAIQWAFKTLSRLKQVPTVVAIDEAQIAMDMSQRYFYSQRRVWLPLANRLVESLQVGLPFEPMILVTGTGSTLHFKKDLIGGSGEKMVSSPELFKGFSAWDGPESMKEFAQKVLSLSDDDLLLLNSRTWGVFPLFRGRFRLFCDVIQIMLLKNLTLKEASEYVIQAQTTSATKPEFLKNMGVAAIAEMGRVNGVSLIEELEKNAEFLHDLKDGQGGATPLECSYERFLEGRRRKKQKTQTAI